MIAFDFGDSLGGWMEEWKEKNDYFLVWVCEILTCEFVENSLRYNKDTFFFRAGEGMI